MDDMADIVDPIMERPMYFDKQGEPISLVRWGELKCGVPPSPHDDRFAHLDLGDDLGLDAGDYDRIGYDVVGEATISTVWLGIDHGFHYADKPVIFETLIFGGPYDQHMMRYCTEEEAQKGHSEAVVDVRAGIEPWWAWRSGE